jgi:hypothetical protein
MATTSIFKNEKERKKVEKKLQNKMKLALGVERIPFETKKMCFREMYGDYVAIYRDDKDHWIEIARRRDDGWYALYFDVKGNEVESKFIKLYV